MKTPPSRILLGPGPSNTPQEVLDAIAQPTVGHLDPFFVALLDDLRVQLQWLFRTKNEMTLAISGTGSAGMETLFANLVESGDKVMIACNGVFGMRMKDVAGRYGADVHSVDVPWGEVFDQDKLIAEIERVKPKLFGIVHAETSTGAWQPVDKLGEAVHAAGGLFLLDCVTSLGGVPVEIDKWGVDAAYSGTQKCLSCPPGLSPVTLSEHAMEKVRGREGKVKNWYLDLTMIGNYWGNERTYHHTAPINMLYGLHEAVALIQKDGLEARWEKHQAAHERLKKGLGPLGIDYVNKEGERLPMLNAVFAPEGIDEAEVRRKLLQDYSIEIGPGLGDFKGQVWRIGLMGYNANDAKVDKLLGALNKLLG